MARYTIDATTLVHLLDHDLRPDPGHALVAPASLRTATLQLLLDDVRAGRRTERDARGLHDAVTSLKVRVLGDRMSRGTAWRLAVEHGWDDLQEVEHLAVTRLQADALVTVDPRLRALAQGHVPLATLDDLCRPG